MSKLVINESLQIPVHEFKFTAVRSQGPGGQNVNKVNTKVMLQWNFETSRSLTVAQRNRLRQRARGNISKEGVLTVMSQSSRHQHFNRAECLRKLRVTILDAMKLPKVRKSTKPTKGSVQRRRRDKEMASIKKKRRAYPNLDS